MSNLGPDSAFVSGAGSFDSVIGLGSDSVVGLGGPGFDFVSGSGGSMSILGPNSVSVSPDPTLALFWLSCLKLLALIL